MEAERGLGNAKLIPSVIANVFWEGDRFRTRGISYRNDQVAGNRPLGLKTARHVAVFDTGGLLMRGGGSVIGVTVPIKCVNVRVKEGNPHRNSVQTLSRN